MFAYILAFLVSIPFLSGNLSLAEAPVKPQSDPQPPVLELHEKTFIIRENSQILQVSSAPERFHPPDKVVYRKDDSYAVWDSRGLTIRKGAKSRSIRLPDIPLTPKLFSRDKIIHTRDLIASGQRSKSAAALSGSRRIGDIVYFLVRWNDKGGVPWLEAFVQVDLSSESVESNLVGKFEGLSIAREPVGDRLFIRGGELCALTQKEDKTWGLATFDPTASKFQFKPIGRDLLEYCASENGCVIAEEGTSYGSKVLARANLDNAMRSPLHEFRGAATLLSTNMPCVARISSLEGEYLLNLETGSTLRISKEALARTVQQRVLVWLPRALDQAKLYEPIRWNAVAQVTSAPQPAHPSLHSRSLPVPPARLALHPNR